MLDNLNPKELKYELISPEERRDTMSNYQENLSRILRQARHASGLTQKQVAQALYINRTTYTYYENAKSLPTLDTLKKAASLFSIPLEYLLYPEKYQDELPISLHKKIRPPKG